MTNDMENKIQEKHPDHNNAYTKDDSDDSGNNRLKLYTQHLYDDIFLYLFLEQTQLFLPLISEAFELHYDYNTPIRIESQHFMTNGQKKVVDAFLSIEDNLFHFECESRNREILLRLEDYDSLIARRFKSKSLYTAVLYIRNTKLGDYGILADGRKVPYIKVQNYSLQEMIDNKLYILLPYYIMRYEWYIKHNHETRYNIIVSELKTLYNELEQLDDIDLSNSLCKMCVEVVLRISKHSTFADYLKKEGAMPMSWMTYEEEIEQAKRETLTTKDRTTVSLIKNLMDTSQESFDKVCDMLKIRHEDAVRYSKMM